MFERFTDRARRVTVNASNEAKRLHHDRVETGHWLIGLMDDPDSLASKALDWQGLTSNSVRYLVEELNKRPAFVQGSGLPYSPESKWLLEMADRERSTIGHHYIGPEHILLAITRLFELEALESDMVVLIFKRYHDVDVAALREEIFRLIKRKPVKADLLEWKGITTVGN